MIYFNTTPFKNPELSDTHLIDKKQSVRRAYSGNIYSMRLREQQVFHLAFKDMAILDAMSMREILRSGVVTYKDYNGATHSVRLADETLEFSLDNAGHRSIQTGNTCTPGVNDWVSFEINLEKV